MMSVGFLRNRRLLSAAAWMLTGMFASVAAHADPVPWQLNMTEGVTPTSHDVYWIHMFIFWICVVIGVVVFGAMFVAMFRFRKSRGAVAETWSHSTRLETMWTIIPIIILVICAVPSTKILIDMEDTSKSDMTIKVTGYQWKWRYEYVDYFKQNPGVNFVSSLDSESNRVRQLRSGLDPDSVKTGSENTYLLNVDKPLVLPVGVKVRFVVTADDVIHSWWVPELGWKQDAIPGIINAQWAKIEQPGIYRGQCALLCGKDHGFMPIVVKAVPRAEFEKWLADQESATKAAATAQVPAPVPATRG